MAKNLEDLLGKSKPLEEALKPPEIEEWTPDQLKLLDMGIEESYIKGWYVNNDKAFTSKDNLRMDFFNYLMDCCSLQELNNLIVNDFTTKQQNIFDEKLEAGGVPDLQQDRISEYIDKNKELIAEKDELYKKIQKLQMERDNWQNYANIGINLVKIFVDQEIKTDFFNEEGIEIIKEMYKIDA